MAVCAQSWQAGRRQPCHLRLAPGSAPLGCHRGGGQWCATAQPVATNALASTATVRCTSSPGSASGPGLHVCQGQRVVHRGCGPQRPRLRQSPAARDPHFGGRRAPRQHRALRTSDVASSIATARRAPARAAVASQGVAARAPSLCRPSAQRPPVASRVQGRRWPERRRRPSAPAS